MQQLRQSLKLKWLSYYEDNYSWLVNMRIWAYYDRVRRPTSAFILGILSTLEPQLTEMLSTIVDLNNDPDGIITAFGLNFDPDQELELMKSNQTSLVREDSSHGKALSYSITSEYHQNSEQLPSNISDRKTVTSEITARQTACDPIPQDTSQIAIAQFIPVPSNLVTPTLENHQPISLPHSPQPEDESAIETQPDSDRQVSNGIVASSNTDRQLVTSNGVTKEDEYHTLNGTATEPVSDRQLVTTNGTAKSRDRQTSNGFGIQPAASIYDRQLLASSISIATRSTSDRQATASNSVATQPIRDRQSTKPNGFGTSANGPVRKVIKIFNSLIRPNSNSQETEEKDTVNQSKSSPSTQATNLPSWIDESCQGAAWDRSKDR